VRDGASSCEQVAVEVAALWHGLTFVEEAKKATASEVYRYCRMMELPWKPEDHGFVCSAQEMEVEVGRREMRVAALLARNSDYDRVRYEA
jgi:hypothetical protein